MFKTIALSKYELRITQIIRVEMVIIRNNLNSSGVKALKKGVPSVSLFVPESMSSPKLELADCFRNSSSGIDSKTCEAAQSPKMANSDLYLGTTVFL